MLPTTLTKHREKLLSKKLRGDGTTLNKGSRYRLADSLERLGMRNLKEYWASELWAKTKARFRAYKAIKYRCYACHSTNQLALHHRNYERLGCEDRKDCVWMCSGCHDAVHALVAQFGIKIHRATKFIQQEQMSARMTHRRANRKVSRKQNLEGHLKKAQKRLEKAEILQFLGEKAEF